MQLWYQVKSRLVKPRFIPLEAPTTDSRILRLKEQPIPREHCLDGDVFTFINIAHEFSGWGFNGLGNLWTYNQNYFDFINQEGIFEEEGCKWIDRFIQDVLESPDKTSMSLDPYPIALRSINWIKFFCRYPESATKARLDSLYSQVLLLEKKLEYHLLANHLLEDAYAIYIGAAYFGDERIQRKATKLLQEQLQEQILPDGAHYEQSPMYHCILLDRLLDCFNIRPLAFLEDAAVKMLGHLESITWSDGSIPLLNDAAYGIAPTADQLFDYARRLGIQWKAIPMNECGYRKLQKAGMEAIVDVGNITASYQPGHTHADTFNYELRIDGKPFIVDTGISTYNKDERRQLERGTVAHNTVSVNGKDSSEVWGGFRVGRRAKVSGIKVFEGSLEASHDGFGKACKRRFEMTSEGFTVQDWYDGEAASYLHLAECADAERVFVEGATTISVNPWKYSTEYNVFHEGTVIEIRFRDYLKYSIR